MFSHSFIRSRALASSASSTRLRPIRLFSTSTIRYARSKVPTLPNSSIKVFRDIDSLRQWRKQQLIDYRSVALVPTMGALHDGHLSLIRLAAKSNSSVVVSIYVNPTQFGINEDLASYPQTWESDTHLLRTLDHELADSGSNLGTISAIFAPQTSTMYPSGPPGQELTSNGSFITLTPLSNLLEGKTRPTFFRGVATVCMKLFNIVQPDVVYFGQKDIQQTIVIKKMVRDFCLPTTVEIGETKREDDGLAMSSRNIYLGTRRRAVAPILYNALRIAEQSYLSGHRTRDEILGPAMELIRLVMMEQSGLGEKERVGFEIDYFSLADPESMEEVEIVDEERGAVLSAAFKMLSVEEVGEGEDLGANGGKEVRLIDNIILKPLKA